MTIALKKTHEMCSSQNQTEIKKIVAHNEEVINAVTKLMSHAVSEITEKAVQMQCDADGLDAKTVGEKVDYFSNLKITSAFSQCADFLVGAHVGGILRMRLRTRVSASREILKYVKVVLGEGGIFLGLWFAKFNQERTALEFQGKLNEGETTKKLFNYLLCIRHGGGEMLTDAGRDAISVMERAELVTAMIKRRCKISKKQKTNEQWLREKYIEICGGTNNYPEIFDLVVHGGKTQCLITSWNYTGDIWTFISGKSEFYLTDKSVNRNRTFKTFLHWTNLHKDHVCYEPPLKYYQSQATTLMVAWDAEK
jgi:hypothetical protein